ncbi:aminotransferase class V-fold PLP-dependent enzyme [Salinarimonas soli]|uniref:Aminotransferase class V-fold PLP-dependent enzyme n=1 Tax=Salinarimonas soli TaxID=1638099 RepID=A0A5B2VRR3_9HYPH|nr:aminotransferase class V-fold PLP-dependent enzyme [Salinarimonas soli]KAA2241036.1 aminotransferase class V-fold PLP-dependent enzyme [Salinarimonas soli]
MLDLRSHFASFLGADPERLHLAAHSHHLWPDVSRAAQLAAWDDAARLVDDKWGHVMGPVWREAQEHVVRHLNLPDPGTIVFAANTFEFWLRLLSCFSPGQRVRVLATDGEFHSFRRLSWRLVEDGSMELEEVAAEPHATFAERFSAAAARGGHDIVLFSQVFFGSGFEVTDLPGIVAAVPDRDTFVVIDGYHGFLALPTDLAPVADRVFYLSGGYKYAMSGEGAAFMHCPPGYGNRPRATGWYAAFSELAASQNGEVAYAPDGFRFMGATFDPTSLYRFNAVMRWLAGLGIDAGRVRAHVRALQEGFVAALGERGPLHPDDLVVPLADARRGSFLTFRRADAADLHARLASRRIVTDVRGDRLRIGFGLYHAAEDAPRAARRIAETLGGVAG